MENTSKVGLINEQGYVFSLEREITLLKEENDSLKEKLEAFKNQDLPSYKAAERERKAFIELLLHLDQNLRGIPAIVKIIREVIQGLIEKVESGEHINVSLHRQYKK